MVLPGYDMHMDFDTVSYTDHEFDLSCIIIGRISFKLRKLYYFVKMPHLGYRIFCSNTYIGFKIISVLTGAVLKKRVVTQLRNL